MDNVFESPQHRRVFFGAATLLLVCIVVIRVYIAKSAGPNPSELDLIWISILDNLLAGIFASILVGGTIYFFRPRRTFSGNVSHLNANEIVPAFDISLDAASRWIFVGNRGRYLRSKVLPKFAIRGGSSPVEIVLLDPCSSTLCRSFIEYKSSSVKLSSDEGLWNEERIQAEVIATVTVCAWYAKNPHVSISLFLAPTFSPIRMDSSTATTFLTAENKREPAMVFKAPHFYNDWLMHHFAVVKRQSRPVIFPIVTARRLLDIQESDVVAACVAAGLAAPSQSLVSSALKIARTNVDPYA